jgi:hypothetical protein
MNDVEHDLRELFDRKAGSVGTVAPRLPDGVRARSRRRQSSTVLVGGLTALALVLGSVGLLRAIDRAQPDSAVPAGDPWAGYTVFERTATIENFTITGASDWYLVDQWSIGVNTITSFSGTTESCQLGPNDQEQQCDTVESSPTSVDVPRGLPLFQLSNVDLGLGMPRCGERLAEDEAVLYVAVDSDALGSGTTPSAWPVQLQDRPSGPCGPGMYASFSAGSVPYLAWAGFGGSVGEDDRTELLAAFGRLQVTDGKLEPPRTRGPAYVIAGGENAAGAWSLKLRPSSGSGSSPNVELQLETSDGKGSELADIVVPNELPIEQAGGDPVFGAVVKQAEAVELRLEDGTPPILAQIVPLPPSMPFAFDLFFASNEADVQATAIAIGPNGEELTSGEAPAPSVSGTPEPTPNERRRVAAGATGGTEWALEYEQGRELALVGSSDDIMFDRIASKHMASLSAESPMLIRAHDFGSTEQALFLLYGLTNKDVDQLVITFADGRVIQLGRGTMRDPSIHIFGQNPNVSPGVWWVQMPPGSVVANVTAFDAACQRLGRAGLALRPEGTEQEESPTVAECPPLGG